MKRFAPILLMCGCAPSFESELADLRAEIVEMEKQRLSTDASIWPDKEPVNFNSLVTDGDTRLPDFIYFHVLKKLQAGSEEEFRKLGSPTFDAEQCMETPAAYRGKFWRLSGVIAEAWVEKLPGPDSPAPQVYGGVLFTESKKPVFFHVLEKPNLLRLNEDFIELDGLFFKVLAYRTSSGKWVSAPFFIAKSLRKYM